MFDFTVTVTFVQATATPRRARIAAMISFATNGALPASLLARYAEVKEELALEPAIFGLVVVGFTVGAVAAFNLPGIILRRFGSRWTASIGTAWVAVVLSVAAWGVITGRAWLFVAGIVLAGLGDAVVDVAQNSQGLRVQQEYRRSLLSSMHAGWSIGAVIGGVVGTLAASLGLSLLIHLMLWGLVCVLAMSWAAASFLPDVQVVDRQTAPVGAPGWRIIRLLIPLALVALAGAVVEDIGNNWSAVLLASEHGVAASAAGVALSVTLVAQFAGRLLGDRFIDSFGNRRAVILSLSAVTVGLLLAGWAPWVGLSLVGLALAGLGSAITVPLAFAGADSIPGLRQHAGVTWIGWSMRLVAVGLSPAIGGISGVTSLSVAITVASTIPLVALLGQLRQRPPRH